MSEIRQNQPNPTRRRRKPRRPKWVKNKFTYQLWRNWPLIRFVLLCLVALSLVIGMAKCTVGLFKDDTPDETTPDGTTPVQTTPPETTAPPEPTDEELLRQADAMAAGYDYEGAIAMLSSSSHASSSEFQSRIA